MFIPKNKLDNMNPTISSKQSSLYYLNNFAVAIIFKNLNNIDKEILYAKYVEATKLKDLEEVMLPIDIIENENGLCGYIEKSIPEDTINFASLVNKNISLNDISAYILSVCDIVSKCHKNGIINPDIASLGNVLYNPKAKKGLLNRLSRNASKKYTNKHSKPTYLYGSNS